MLAIRWPTEPRTWSLPTDPECAAAHNPNAPPCWAQCESLAQGLRAVLAAHRVERSYLELVALLGLGARFRVSPAECIAEWVLAAQDVRLVETAALYGLQLREMHPPDAAVGVTRSAEFPAHFRDSYVPLIRRALEHGQPCLARRGWPPPNAAAWGVITAAEGETLLGITSELDGARVPLIGPAVQVYVVEDYRPVPAGTLSTERLLAHAVTAATVSGAEIAAGYAPRNAYLKSWQQWRSDHGAQACPGCGGRADDCWLRLHTHLYLAGFARNAWYVQTAPHWSRAEIDKLVHGE